MNILYYGDNLEVLRQKLRDDTIDLCYIDPPFNSKRNYFQIYNNIGKEDAAQAQAFIDTWTWNQLAMEGYQEIITNYQGRYTSQTIELLKGLKAVLGYGGLLAYLISMTQRVNEIQRVLKPTGSFYLHCDPTASHYLKLILDGVFCVRGGDFRNEVIWHYRRWTNTSQKFKQMHDVMLYYSKGDKITFNKIEILPTNSQQLVIDRGYNVNKVKSKTGKILQLFVYNKTKVEDLIKSGKLDLSKYDKVIYRDTIYTEASDVWEIQYLHSQAKERLGYPTQKPEALLERIIQASSNEGDTILDAYCGCGTTVAVAQRLNRHWIGIDITYQSIAVILKRLKDSFGEPAIAEPTALQLNGIPRDIESARALANKQDDRLRKEFEKWAILTYSDNQASINEKKA